MLSGSLIDKFGGGPVEGLLQDFALSPDRTHIVTARTDNTAWIWDVKHGHPLTSLVGHTARIRAARYSDDKKYLVTASDDGTVRVWDSSRWQLRSILDERPAIPAHAFFSSDGQWVVAYEQHFDNGMDRNDAVRVWDWRENKLLAVIRESAPVRNLRFSADRKRMLWVTGEDAKTVVVRDLSNGRELARLREHSLIESAESTPDMKSVVTVTIQGVAHIWDVKGENLAASLQGSDFRQAEFTPSGNAILTVQRLDSDPRFSLPLMDREGEIRMWDPHGRTYLVIGKTRARSAPFVFSPDAMRAVRIIDDATIHEAPLVETRRGRLLRDLNVSSDYLTSAEFSFDGKRFAIASGNATAGIWDAFHGGLFTTLRGHTGRVDDVVFSPDAQRIATGSSDNSVRLWNVNTGQLLSTFFPEWAVNTNWHPTDELQKEHSVQFSPDGKYVLVTCSAASLPIFEARRSIFRAERYSVFSSLSYRKLKWLLEVTAPHGSTFK